MENDLEHGKQIIGIDNINNSEDEDLKVWRNIPPPALSLQLKVFKYKSF